MIEGETGIDHCILGQTEYVLPLNSWTANQAAALALARQARLALDIFTDDMEPAIYDQQPMLEAIRQLAVRSRRSRVRVLVKDSTRAVKEDHRLVALARHLSSFIAIRKTHEDVADFPEAFLIADHQGVLHRKLATRYEGTACFRAPLQARQLTHWFTEVWERSTPDPELRRIHL